MPTTTVHAWHIYYVPRCRYAKPEPKDKLIAVVCVNEQNCLGFFINSRISGFINNRPHLLTCQASILYSEHACLTHDSYIDTNSVLVFDHSELVQVRDEISDNAKNSILVAVENCLGIERRHKKRIIAAGKEYFPDSE